MSSSDSDITTNKPKHHNNITKMTSQGDYSVVVDIDDEGDLGDLDYNPDPVFQNSSKPPTHPKPT